jgi:hypothetical protein
MLATLGWVFADFHSPVLGVSSFEAHAASVTQGGLLQVLIWVSILEHVSIVANRELGKGREPGDFSFDPLGLGKKDLKRMQTAELKNGRLAMMAISGIATQAGLGHTAFPYL